MVFHQFNAKSPQWFKGFSWSCLHYFSNLTSYCSPPPSLASLLTCQTCFSLITFAFSAPSTWNALFRDIYMTCSLTFHTFAQIFWLRPFLIILLTSANLSIIQPSLFPQHCFVFLCSIYYHLEYKFHLFILFTEYLLH